MAVNHYFNNFPKGITSEHRLLEDLITESIRIYGHNIYYLPREVFDAMDHVYGEAPNSYFQRAYIMEMYMANVEGYEGEGDFFSKFGLEIRDTSNFVVSRKTFQKYMPSSIAARPREGDLLYVPVISKIMEIKFVEEELLFFSLGKSTPYMYELRCEVFRFSQENIKTGIQDVDQVESNYSFTIPLTFTVGTGNFMAGEEVYQGANLSSSLASAVVNYWEPDNNILYVYNTKGDFVGGEEIIGQTSNARYTLQYAEMMNRTNEDIGYDIIDNGFIQDDANTVIVLTEKNIFGEP